MVSGVSGFLEFRGFQEFLVFGNSGDVRNAGISGILEISANSEFLEFLEYQGFRGFWDSGGFRSLGISGTLGVFGELESSGIPGRLRVLGFPAFWGFSGGREF